MATASDASVSAEPDAADPKLCPQGERISCVCASGGVGEQLCTAGVYGSCEGCTTGPAVTASKCVAGVYRGRLDMNYGSTASGLCGVIGPLARQEHPGEFLFSLDQAGSVEFYTVGNGCFQVPPPVDPMAYDIKFRAALTGNVNCATGELKLAVKATYGVVSLCTLGQVREQFFAKGTMIAQFNAQTETFENGAMELAEPKVWLGDQPGGKGTFTAKLDPSAMIDNTGDCLDGVVFADDKFVEQDAGSE